MLWLPATPQASSGTAASASGDAVYTAGTYTGTATGIGEVKVTMTFSETAITEVVIDASNETESIGGVAAPTLQDAIMAAQGAEIDNVSGATVTTNAVKKAAASCIEQAMGVASDEPADSYRRGYRRTTGWATEPDDRREPMSHQDGGRGHRRPLVGCPASAGVAAVRSIAEDGGKSGQPWKRADGPSAAAAASMPCINGNLCRRKWGRENTVDP